MEVKDLPQTTESAESDFVVSSISQNTRLISFKNIFEKISFSSLTTTVKNIIGAINELKADPTKNDLGYASSAGATYDIAVNDLSKYRFVLFELIYGEMVSDSKLIPIKYFKASKGLRLYHLGTLKAEIKYVSNTKVNVVFKDAYYPVHLYLIK